MTKEQQEKEVKELAKEIFKFMHPGDKFRIGNNRTDYIISLAQHLISKGYRKAGELTVISDKERAVAIADGIDSFVKDLTKYQKDPSHKTPHPQSREVYIHKAIAQAQRDHDREA